MSQVEKTGTRRAGEQVGRDHREADRQRQRNEELPAHADHEERRHEDGQDAEHREQARHGGAAAGFEHGARARDAGQHLGVDVLDLDRRFVHQHADRERQAAERHDVDGLAGGPQQDHGAEQRERNVQDHDQGAAPVAQEDQHHQAGEHRAEQAFGDQAANGVGDVGRLIELQAHVDVVGHHLLEIGNRGFHAR